MLTPCFTRWQHDATPPCCYAWRNTKLHPRFKRTDVVRDPRQIVAAQPPASSWQAIQRLRAGGGTNKYFGAALLVIQVKTWSDKGKHSQTRMTMLTPCITRLATRCYTSLLLCLAKHKTSSRSQTHRRGTRSETNRRGATLHHNKLPVSQA